MTSQTVTFSRLAGLGQLAASVAHELRNPLSTKPQGTGLGLYICRRIIESLHGQLGYRDSKQGVTFWFELPAAPMS